MISNGQETCGRYISARHCTRVCRQLQAMAWRAYRFDVQGRFNVSTTHIVAALKLSSHDFEILKHHAVLKFLAEGTHNVLRILKVCCPKSACFMSLQSGRFQQALLSPLPPFHCITATHRSLDTVYESIWYNWLGTKVCDPKPTIACMVCSSIQSIRTRGPRCCEDRLLQPKKYRWFFCFTCGWTIFLQQETWYTLRTKSPVPVIQIWLPQEVSSRIIGCNSLVSRLLFFFGGGWWTATRCTHRASRASG